MEVNTFCVAQNDSLKMAKNVRFYLQVVTKICGTRQDLVQPLHVSVVKQVEKYSNLLQFLSYNNKSWPACKGINEPTTTTTYIPPDPPHSRDVCQEVGLKSKLYRHSIFLLHSFLIYYQYPILNYIFKYNDNYYLLIII